MKKIERIKDKVIIAFVCLITILLVALLPKRCGRNPDGSINLKNTTLFKVETIDSCEYVIYHSDICHKGNCRFCLERQKKMIKEQIDSALIQKFD